MTFGDIEAALEALRGDVTAAAERLGVPSAGLRSLVWATPSLAEAVLAERCRARSEAWLTLESAIRAGTEAERLTAMGFLVEAADGPPN